VAFVMRTHEFVGGAEASMVLLAEYLPPRYEVIALLSDRAADRTIERLSAVGARSVRVAGLRRRPTPASVLRLSRTLGQLGPAIVHVNATDQGDGLTGLLAARLARIPSVLNVRNVIPDRSRPRELASAWAIRRADLALAPSDFVGSYLRRLGARTAVVMNGVPAPHLNKTARAELGLQEDAFVVGGIGRLHRQKGWDVLCEAAEKVRRKRPDLIFIVVGDGEERTRLASLPSCANVRFVGYRRSASSLLSAFDILAVPSRYEAFGRAAVEAMLAGVPVVASAVQALPEVLDQHAVFVPPEDAEALAAALLQLTEDEQARRALAGAARDRAEAFFGVERMADETADAYDLLVEEHQARASRAG
jgi:glycosyltransferase involved in cell wall biosynthesis